MLPASRSEPLNLGDVMPSCVASLRGKPNTLGLPAARKAVMVVIDGLGASMLASRRGHARNLISAFTKNSKIRAEFPTTTAASLTTLLTGVQPGTHGMVGYSVLDPVNDVVRNQLTGWGADMRPDTWQRSETVFETTTDLPSFSVGPSRYARSGFTEAVLRGSRYLSAESVDERCQTAREVLDEHPEALIYLYIPELDQLAHRFGWESDSWIRGLEDVDASLARLAQSLRPDEGMLITADHGVVDVPARGHILIDPASAYCDGVRHFAGEPRCAHLYFEPDASPAVRAQVTQLWRATEGDRSDVLTRSEAITRGWFGSTVDDEVMPRIGDLLVAPRKLIAYYRDAEDTVSAQSMIGQHGSRTDEESVVPLLRWGAYAR